MVSVVTSLPLLTVCACSLWYQTGSRIPMTLTAINVNNVSSRTAVLTSAIPEDGPRHVTCSCSYYKCVRALKTVLKLLMCHRKLLVSIKFHESEEKKVFVFVLFYIFLYYTRHAFYGDEITCTLTILNYV